MRLEYNPDLVILYGVALVYTGAVGKFNTVVSWQIKSCKAGNREKNAAIIQTCSSERLSSRYHHVFSAEIPEFLSEDECRVVMQLAQLKGLMESQLMVQDGQEELAKELNLTPDEIFSLLDINQDGQLQLHEVHFSLWIGST